MVSPTSSVAVTLSKNKLAAVRRTAKRLHVTPAQYLKCLIVDGLAREVRIRETPLQVLASPIHESLKEMTDDGIDALVEKARSRNGSKRRRD